MRRVHHGASPATRREDAVGHEGHEDGRPEGREGEEGADRGRDADRPREIPAKGWKDIAVRVKEQSKAHNVPLLAAGVALFLLLATIPALIAAISLDALVADPQDIQRHMEDLTATAPEEVRELLTRQFDRIAQESGAQATIGFVAGLVAAVWAASSGMKHLISAVNVAYDEPEERGFLKLRGLSLLFTAGGLVLFAVAIGVITVLPVALDLSGALAPVVRFVPYVLLAVLFVCALALVYRFAPDRDDAQFRWVTWGAVMAAVVWIVASLGFSFYVSNFGSDNETYGSLAAVIVLILWLLITAYAIVLGAELNSEIEAQTGKDSTVGEPRPPGERNAVKADELGPTADDLRR